MLDNNGGLLRGSIDLTFKLSDIVFCRRVAPYDHQKPRYKFWTLPPESATGESSLKFRVVFWCDPSQSDDDDASYSRLDVSLLSEYPHSFPRAAKTKWLQWLQKAAFQMLQEEQISYSVCVFIENHALDYFQTLYQNEIENQTLICFDDEGPAFYNVPTLISATGGKRLHALQRHYPNGKCETFYDTSKLTVRERTMIVSILLKWREWLPIECPICFDTVCAKDATICPCDHGFCKSCLTTYLRIKAKELNTENPTNPFICPINACRRGMKIVGFVKPFLSRDLMDEVRAWYKDIKNPPCYSLPGCMKKGCKGTGLRKEAVDNFMIFCEECQGRWCELCLQRAPMGKQHEDTPHCKMDVCQQFCERYLAASDEAKALCETKYPWIKLYANARVHDHTIVLWIQANGQVCPGCKTGIERAEGCFHMSCGCGTHFCYECGDQIFPPYYGTHHCWENPSRQFMMQGGGW
jgi:Zinc finger, C3HC4 type (RING finger)